MQTSSAALLQPGVRHSATPLLHASGNLSLQVSIRSHPGCVVRLLCHVTTGSIFHLCLLNMHVLSLLYTLQAPGSDHQRNETHEARQVPDFDQQSVALVHVNSGSLRQHTSVMLP